MADVYDALTSKRVYKDAYTPEKAIEMIVNGECGVFNPQLLQGFIAIKDRLTNLLHPGSDQQALPDPDSEEAPT